jgi:hypothetical protein
MQFGLRKVRRGPKPQPFILYLFEVVDYIDNKVKILIQSKDTLLPRSTHENIALAQRVAK